MEGRLRLFLIRKQRRCSVLFILFLLTGGLVLAEDQPAIHNSGLERAIWLRQQGRYEDSLAILEREINGKYSKENSVYRAHCWLNMALDYWNQGEVSRAENAFIYVLALVGELKDEELRDYARTSLNIIKLYQEAKGKKLKGDYAEAERIYKSIIDEAKSKGMYELALKCSRQLSFVYWDQKKHEKIHELNEETLEISVSLNNFYEQVRSLNQLGAYFFEKRDILKSYDYFDRALVLSGQKNLLHRDPVILLNLAATSYQLGLYDLSEHYIERALEFYESGDDLATTIFLLSGLAISLHKKAELNNSIANERPVKLLSTALELSRQAGLRELEARMLNNLGYILLNTDPERARELCQLSWKMGEELKDYQVIVSSLNNLATLSLGEKNLTQAKELFQRALSLALRIDYWSEIWRNYYGLGRCFEQLGDYKSAYQQYQRALEALTPIREGIAFDLYRLGFDRGTREVYEGLIGSIVKLRMRQPGREIDEAVFATLNSVKARVFMEELERLASAGTTVQQMEELARINRMISDFLSRPENVQDRTSLFRLTELEYRYLRLQDIRSRVNGQSSPGNVLNLDFVQKEVLLEDQLILDYFLGREESYCFAVSKNSFLIIKLPAETEIERSIKLYIKLLASPTVGEADLRRAGKKIGQLLLPVEEPISGKYSTLIIIPDGLLNNLPFETLILPAPGDPEGGYLLESVKVHYSPALATIGRLRTDNRTSDQSKELLAFGDPHHNRWFKNQLKTRIYFVNGVEPSNDYSLEALPFSRKEIKQLIGLFPGASYDFFLGKKATEDNLKSLDLSQYRIIHFACHGLISEKFPQRSSLVLTASRDSAEDGFLTTREIYTLRLNSELVVLAACQSSRGSIEKAEGTIGLPRVFLLAGSCSVVSALWSINDRASQELMLEFYRGLLAGKPKDEALRQAKLKMLKTSRSHPYYWAGYILIGNARPIY